MTFLPEGIALSLNGPGASLPTPGRTAYEVDGCLEQPCDCCEPMDACVPADDGSPQAPKEQAQCLHWARSGTPKELHTRDHHQSAKTQEWRTRALQWWEALCAPQIRLVLLALRDWTFPFPFSDLLLDETTLGSVVLAPFMFHAIFLPLLGWLPIITWLFLVAVQTLHFGSSTN